MSGAAANDATATRRAPPAQHALPKLEARVGRWLPATRLIVVLMLGAYFVLLLALGGRRHWNLLGVTPDHIPFGDLMSLTSAWQCTRLGLAVMVANPCDPLHHAANYPSIWTRASFLGLGPGDNFALGFAVAALFLVAAVAVVPPRCRPRDAVVYGLALCSPAVMLGVERGNVDILLFALVVVAALIFRRDDRLAIVAHFLILAAAVLKLFPIFATAMLLRQTRRRALIGIGVVLGAFLFYLVAIRSEIRTLIHVTPQVDDFSYGLRLVSEWLAGVSASVDGSTLGWLRLREWNALVALAVVVAIVAYRRRRQRWTRPEGPGAERDFDLFLAGAGVYAGTYVLINSFDYRLVFLLLTLPQLLRWAEERRPVALVTLVAAFGALWLDPTLTASMPVVGTLTHNWDEVTVASYQGIGRALTLAAIAQLVLFAGIVACVTASVTGLAEPRRRTETPHGPPVRAHGESLTEPPARRHPARRRLSSTPSACRFLLKRTLYMSYFCSRM